MSKLQTEITLSTTEAEYVALSHAMRETLPFIELVQEINMYLKLNDSIEQALTKCTVFEDNNGCIELATCPKLRPRTKHIAIKYHHFREKVQSGMFKVRRIDTNDQEADIFTKALPPKLFESLRKRLNGW